MSAARGPHWRFGVAAGLLVAASVVLAAGARPLAAQEGRPQVQRSGKRPNVSTNEELQPDTLPTLPAGMTLDMIRAGDSIFHGKGACFVCHGAEGQGRPAAGDALTVTLNYVPYKWGPIDSLITAGLPDALTRSPIRMPPRGGKSDLTDAEIQRVAAYVWAISQTKGEPWPGGHTSHAGMVPIGATFGTAPERARP